MLKPPNIQSVYPLRDESDEFTEIEVAKSDRKGPVVIANIEAFDPQSLLYIEGHEYVVKLIHELSDFMASPTGQMSDLVIVHDAKSKYMVTNLLKKYGVPATFVEAKDFYNTAFSKSTEQDLAEKDR